MKWPINFSFFLRRCYQPLSFLVVVLLGGHLQQQQHLRLVGSTTLLQESKQKHKQQLPILEELEEQEQRSRSSLHLLQEAASSTKSTKISDKQVEVKTGNKKNAKNLRGTTTNNNKNMFLQVTCHL